MSHPGSGSLFRSDAGHNPDPLLCFTVYPTDCRRPGHAVHLQLEPLGRVGQCMQLLDLSHEIERPRRFGKTTK